MSQFKILSIVFIVLSLSYLAKTDSDHEIGCNHDAEEYNPDIVTVDDVHSEEEGRLLRSSGYPQFRIYPNYDYVNSGSRSIQSYIKNDLVPPVISYFQSALRIKRPLRTNLKVRSGTRQICDYNTPNILKTVGVSADHFTSFATVYESNNYLATASFCQVSDDLKRPIISRVKLNLNYLEVPNGDPLVHEKNTNLLIHEMSHALGYSYQLFPNFVDDNGNRLQNHLKTVSLNGNSRRVLDVPSLTRRMRNHFGCSSLPGLYLENNGDWQLTQNSHPERRHHLIDTMTAGQLNGARITELTLAVFEASGWYTVDYNYAEPNPFGAGQGCNFVYGNCAHNSPFEEYCNTPDYRGCFTTGRGGGKCKSDPNSDNCKYHSPTVNFDCNNPKAASQTRLSNIQVFGRTSGSKCFDGTLSENRNDRPMSFCFRFSCVGSGSHTTLQVQVGNRNVVCSQKGTVSVPGYQGTINCPDPLTYCQTTGKSYCPRNCMGRGNCSNGHCVCYRGFTGLDCSERT